MADRFESSIGPREGDNLARILGDVVGHFLPYTVNTGAGSLAAPIPGTERSLALMPTLEALMPLGAGRVHGMAKAAARAKLSKDAMEALQTLDWKKIQDVTDRLLEDLKAKEDWATIRGGTAESLSKSYIPLASTYIQSDAHARQARNREGSK